MEKGMNQQQKAFWDLVKDILQNPEYQKLQTYYHHSSSIWEHCLQVGYFSYVLGSKFGMDTTALARGGVLHDFFLYDWRSDRFRCSSLQAFKESHAFRHPKIALQNAQREFTLTAREKDIILNHMWPATLRLPQYKETYLVGLVDKYAACGEYLSGKLSVDTRGKRKFLPLTLQTDFSYTCDREKERKGRRRKCRFR